MSKQAGRFVIELSKDPAKLKRFLADPDKAMRGTDLSDLDRKVLRSRDGERIKRHLGGFGPTACIIVYGRHDDEDHEGVHDDHEDE